MGRAVWHWRIRLDMISNSVRPMPLIVVHWCCLYQLFHQKIVSEQGLSQYWLRPHDFIIIICFLSCTFTSLAFCASLMFCAWLPNSNISWIHLVIVILILPLQKLQTPILTHPLAVQCHNNTPLPFPTSHPITQVPSRRFR